MTRIFIENNELDLTQGLSNQLTYAIDDLQNLDSKSTAFSKTIILPGTTRNNALLGNIFEFTNANFSNDNAANVNYNFNASRSAVCRIEVDGMQIIKGVFRLLEIIRDGRYIEYECAVFGELGGFVNALGNSRLEDLDFSAYNHNYTYANITNSWSFTAGSGYVYPLVDYGNYSTNKKDFQYKTFRPALFLREYIDKIITNVGYTWESNFFNTAFFKRIIIPCNQKVLSTKSSILLDVRQTTTISYTGVATGTFITFNNLIKLGDFTPSSNQFFVNGGASKTFPIQVYVYISDSFVTTSGENWVIELRVGGSPVASQTIPANIAGYAVEFNQTITVNTTQDISVAVVRPSSGLLADYIDIDNSTILFSNPIALQRLV